MATTTTTTKRKTRRPIDQERYERLRGEYRGASDGTIRRWVREWAQRDADSERLTAERRARVRDGLAEYQQEMRTLLAHVQRLVGALEAVDGQAAWVSDADADAVAHLVEWISPSLRPDDEDDAARRDGYAVTP
jgi:hypothetical protein